MRITDFKREIYKLFNIKIFEKVTTSSSLQIDELIDPVISLERNIKDLKIN